MNDAADHPHGARSGRQAPADRVAAALQRGRRWRRRATSAALLAILIASWRGAAADPSALWDPHNLRALAKLLAGFLPLDLSGSFLAVVAAAVWRTLALALAGTLLAAALGLPLGLLASVRLWGRGELAADAALGPRLTMAAASVAARACLRLVRAVPDVAWALVFVVAMGLGPLPATAALAISNAGVLGRVAGELFDTAPQEPQRALRAAGATRLQIFARAIWPATSSAVVGYLVYTFECAVRAAAVLGMVGGGGLGQGIAISLRLFEYRQVATLLVATLAVVLLGELLARGLRAAVERRAAFAPRSRPWRRRGLALALGAGALGLALALREAGLADLALERGDWLRLGRFFASTWPLKLDAGFLRSLWRPTIETVSVAVLGTALGVAGGGALGVWASTTVTRPVADDGVGAGLARAAWVSARAALAVLRSIPELVWVPLAIVAVGLGPFAGALALGLHTAGVLGRLYAEALDDIPPHAPRALAASGAGALQRLWWCTAPLALPRLVSFTLLRFEFNLRAATVVGLVGGGGLGLLLSNALQLGFYQRAGTLVLVIWGLVGALEAVARRALGADDHRPQPARAAHHAGSPDDGEN